MNKQALRIKAKEVIEEKLGLKVSNKDIVLLEASTAEGNRIDYILFKRYGFDAIEYRYRWNKEACRDELTIINEVSNTTIQTMQL